VLPATIALDLRAGVKGAALFAAPLVLGGCAGLPRYGAPVSGAAAPPSLVKHCEQRADEAGEASAIDALPPDPPAKNALGAFIGNTIGKSIVRRRSYRKCMEKAGYVRLH
jgi:hypothetical protein